jgi:hypothetical protein
MIDAEAEDLTTCCRGGTSVPTYKDLLGLVRICFNQARRTKSSEPSAALFRLAREYNRRAAELETAKNHEQHASRDNQRVTREIVISA